MVLIVQTRWHSFNPLPLKEEEETNRIKALKCFIFRFNPLPLKEEEETAA
ncbi:hypothetical protein [Leptospira kirschneri]